MLLNNVAYMYTAISATSTEKCIYYIEVLIQKVRIYYACSLFRPRLLVYQNHGHYVIINFINYALASESIHARKMIYHIL